MLLSSSRSQNELQLFAVDYLTLPSVAKLKILLFIIIISYFSQTVWSCFVTWIYFCRQILLSHLNPLSRDHWHRNLFSVVMSSWRNSWELPTSHSFSLVASHRFECWEDTAQSLHPVSSSGSPEQFTKGGLISLYFFFLFGHYLVISNFCPISIFFIYSIQLFVKKLSFSSTKSNQLFLWYP